MRLDPVMAQREVKTTGRLSLTSFSHRFDLQLQSNDLRAPNSRAEEVVNGIAHDLPRGEANTFKGTVAGLPNTDARFTIDGSHVEGMILTPDATYFIEPAQKYSRAAGSSDYLLYTAADVQSDLTAACGDTLARKVDLRAKEFVTGNSVVPNAVAPMRVVELATEADDEYVAALGGSSAATSDILTIMNSVDAIYRRDVGLTFSIVLQHTWNGGDPYSTSGDPAAVLNEFANYWNNNITTPRDDAHMWTGRSLGGVDGIAFTGVVCRSPAGSYGTSIRETIAPFRVGIPAHEIGHNFGASHCDGQAGCDNTIMVTTQTVANTL